MLCCVLSQVGQDGGEELLASWPDGAEPITVVTTTILQHLDKEGLSPQQALQLSAATFIPVAHLSRLVAPQQLYLKLGGAALAPFAWEVPGQFVACTALLKSLGVQEEPRAEDLVRGKGMLDWWITEWQSLASRHRQTVLSGVVLQFSRKFCTALDPKTTLRMKAPCTACGSLLVCQAPCPELL